METQNGLLYDTKDATHIKMGCMTPYLNKIKLLLLTIGHITVLFNKNKLLVFVSPQKETAEKPIDSRTKQGEGS